jgi:hypothetical protein
LSVLAVIVFLLGTSGATYAQLASDRVGGQQQLPADLNLVPDDTVQLISLTLGKPWNGAEAESLKRVSSLHPVIPSYHLKDLTANLGVEADNIERLIQLSTPNEQVAIVTTIRQYDREKVLAAFVPDAAKMNAGGKEYFHSGQRANSIHFVDDRTLLLGLGQDLQGFLSRPSPAKRDKSLGAAIRSAANGAPIVVYVGAPAIRSIAEDQKLSDSDFASLASASAWQIVAEVKDGLTIKLFADFANADEAANSQAALRLIGEKLASLMPFLQQNMVPFLGNQEAQFPGAGELAPKMSTAIDATAEALKKISVRSKDTRAGAQINIATDEPLTTAVLLLTLTPRAQLQPGP